MTDPTDGPHTPPSAGDRLRAALHREAASVEPSDHGLTRIEEKLMTTQASDRTRRWVLGSVAAAAVALVAVLGAVVALDDGDDTDTPVVADSSTSTPPDETTSTSTSTTTTEPEPAFEPAVDPYGVAYPSPLTSQRFQSPDSAVQSFATEVLGFTELTMSDFRPGDNRSGEIAIADRAGNPETTVFVRRMEDDAWYVLGSEATDITVERPEAGDTLSSPFATAGVALAFEGTVDVLVRAQDDPTTLGEGFVMGSGTPPAGPFEGEIAFDPPSEERPGIVVYRTLSAEDGHVLQASSVPVRLAPAS